jgi:hypothetical protein
LDAVRQYGREEVSTVHNGMTEQQEERLRGAVRAWLAAADELAGAARDDADLTQVMELADQATLARLTFQRTLVELGWTPPTTRPAAGAPAPAERQAAQIPTDQVPAEQPPAAADAPPAGRPREAG